MLGKILCENTDEIIESWYVRWQESDHPHAELSEATLKDHLPLQLKTIGQELLKKNGAESASNIWQVTERLEPELRVTQDFLIEEVIAEYKILTAVVREWVEEHEVTVSYLDFSYFYDAVFELTGEAVRRFVKFQKQNEQKRKEYLAGLIHQMRNPILVIQNQLELLEFGTEKLEGSTIERLKSNVFHLSFLTNRALRLERFDSQNLPVNPQEIFPSELLAKIVGDNAFEARKKGLELKLELDHSIQMKVDVELLKDIIGNLIDNALKYTEKGSVKVAFKGEGDHVLFKVEDTGPGISEQRQKEIFKPVSPGKSGGVGIGLAVVKRSVDAMNGEIYVESLMGKGSSFVVKLPKIVTPRNLSPG